MLLSTVLTWYTSAILLSKTRININKSEEINYPERTRSKFVQRAHTGLTERVFHLEDSSGALTSTQFPRDGSMVSRVNRGSDMKIFQCNDFNGYEHYQVPRLSDTKKFCGPRRSQG